MMRLHQDFPKFEERSTVIVVVGPESAANFKAYWDKHSLPFLGLPDEDHSVLKQYGQEVNIFKLGRMPAQMIIDRKGILRFVHYGHSMQDIPDNDEVLGLVDSINSEQ